MRLLRYSIGAQASVVGVSDGVAVASLAHLLPGAEGDMIAVMARWPDIRDQIATVSRFDIPLSDVTFEAPVARPGKILGIGLNYADHAAEAGQGAPTDQIWFSKAVTAVNRPYGAIERPRVSPCLDYEAELVFVIGKRCRHVAPEAAMEAIFGFAVGNDVSVRDWQLKTSQFMLGKSFDTHAPFGPWIVTRDAVDVSDLEISSFVNGERRQHSRTSRFIFDCAAQIAHLSKAMTLEPGDVIFTGTPEGVGGAMRPPQWLKAGDRVRVEIEGIGFIENEVIDEVAAA